MEDIPLLRDLVILVMIAVPVVLLAHRFRVPSLVGFLLTGVAIGPSALGLISHPDSVNSLAEGAVLLSCHWARLSSRSRYAGRHGAREAPPR
jgi:CPA2 family monovalent cation:H+ antiporter-2